LPTECWSLRKRVQGMTHETFGERLKRLRETNGYTQVQLAKKAGIQQCQVSYLERDHKEPRLITAILLCKALGVSLDDLVLGEKTNKAAH